MADLKKKGRRKPFFETIFRWFKKAEAIIMLSPSIFSPLLFSLRKEFLGSAGVILSKILTTSMLSIFIDKSEI